MWTEATIAHVRLETVAAHRGERPWSTMPERKQPTLPKPRILRTPGTSPPAAEPSRSAEQADAEPRTSAEDDPGEGIETYDGTEADDAR